MYWIIDRLENGFAVCETENGKTADIKISALPKGIKEGDVLKISVDRKETTNRRKKMDKLMNSLFRE